MSNSPSSHITRGYTFAVIAAAALSTTAIFIRHLTLTYQLPALVLAFWRDVFVSLAVFPVLAALGPRLLRVRRADLGYLAIYGFVLALFNSMWTLSVSLNGAAVATVLVYCSAAFTALLGWLLLKERLDWSKLVAVALSLGGCALVSGAADPAVWNGNLAGIMTGVLAGLCYAAYSLMGRAAAQRGLSPWTTLAYTFLFAAGWLLLVNLLPGGPMPGSAKNPAELLWLGNAWAGWGVLFLLAAVPTVAGFGAYNVSLSHLPSSIANLIVSMEPAFTAVLAFFLLGERLTLLQIGGALLVLAAVVLLRVYEGWLAARPPAASLSVPE